MTLAEKLTILTDAAKYDVACTSSGGDRRAAWAKPSRPAAAIPFPPTAGVSPCSSFCSPMSASTTANTV